MSKVLEYAGFERCVLDRVYLFSSLARPRERRIKLDRFLHLGF